MNTRKIFRKQSGFTLLELLIALALTGVVISSVMTLYISQHESYLVQADVATMQQSARVCLSELSRQIRMAGHHLPMGLDAIEASNTNPDTITVVYHGNDCETFLASTMSSPTAELSCGTTLPCFRPDQWVYIFDPDSARGEWFQILTVNGNAISAKGGLSEAYQQDAIIYALNRYKYFINQSDPDNPLLMVQEGFNDPAPYGDHLDDLQFAYRLANGDVVDEPILISDVREVLITVRSKSTLPVFENGLVVTGSSLDSLDRKARVYSASVNMRNVGL